MAIPQSEQVNPIDDASNSAVSDASATPSSATASETAIPTTTPAPDAAGAVRHKLNQSYIWLGALRIVPYILIAILASSGDAIFELLTDSRAAEYGFIVTIVVLVALVVITGLVVLARFISYQYIWYEYSNEEFSFHSGIFSKKRVHIPYQRIQSINQKASLLQRIVGVCTVSIETAGGASNKAVLLPYIEKSAAESLRLELFERKQMMEMRAAGIDVASSLPSSAQNLPSPSVAPVRGIPAPAPGNALDVPAAVANDFRGVFGGELVDTGAVTYEYGLTNKQLILSAITGKTSFFVILGSIIATLASLVSSAGFIFNTSEDEIVSSLAGLISLIPTSWIIGTIVGVLGFFISAMLLIWVVTVIGTCVSYGGFHARRRGNRIETEYGIINHNFNGIDIDRIQSIEISQSFFQRLLKSCTLSLARVTSSTQESSKDSKVAAQAKLIIHPFVKMDKVDLILSQLLPEWGDLPQARRSIPKRATRRAITRRAILQGGGVWLAISTFVLMWICALPFEFDLLSAAELEDYALFYMVVDVISRVLYVIAALIFVFDIIAAILWRSGSGFGYDRSYVTIVNSGFSTDRSITPRSKIQLATVRVNPLQRHRHLVTLSAVTAAGVGSSTLKLIDVDADQGHDWFAWCHPGGNRSMIKETSEQ